MILVRFLDLLGVGFGSWAGRGPECRLGWAWFLGFGAVGPGVRTLAWAARGSG